MINLECPFNFTSIGQVSYNIFKELVKKETVAFFPLKDNLDVSCFEVSSEDGLDIKKAYQQSLQYDRNDNTLCVFHIRGSEQSVGREQSLYTFHETDRLTDYEINILKQKRKVFVSSKYTKEVFDSHLDGQVEVIYAPIGFDSSSFYSIEKGNTEIITFGLRGKLEGRKNTLRILRAWVKTFGGDPRYRLDCSIHNSFYKPEEFQSMIMEALPDKKLPWNVNMLPFLPTNKLYNSALNNADIDLTGMSSCEGFNLPLFQSLCLGKQCIVLNAHVHKDYCNDKNSILIEPNGMIDAVDNKFFLEGNIVSQGEWFDFRESDLVDAMVAAAKLGRVRNTEGEKLQSWTYEKTAEIILSQ